MLADQSLAQALEVEHMGGRRCALYSPTPAGCPLSTAVVAVQVALKHMACQVGAPSRGNASQQREEEEEGGGALGTEEVVFLYQLAEGACPKSYGVNVARLAGGSRSRSALVTVAAWSAWPSTRGPVRSSHALLQGTRASKQAPMPGVREVSSCLAFGCCRHA